MAPAPGEWDSLRDSLRLAAKAADRAKAAEKLRAAFEKRLQELGYSSLATAHAFSALTGPATVEEALAELKQNARLERIVPVPLEFEAVEREPGLPAGHSLTITGVERDGRGIRIAYEIRPPLSSPAGRPRIVALDDCDQYYGNFGGSLGIAGSKDRTFTVGGFTVPLPRQDASRLRVRMSWSRDTKSLWERPAHELRITL
ncbi:MAG TPA: hypothetical protein VMA77_16955 [Solirubrobacteraceae bacterium]|nr:hypothetical protein [Solirubrobacteraceae bacterium]